jgi:hypothetical protein
MQPSLPADGSGTATAILSLLFVGASIYGFIHDAE